jgi:hypothetical protein
MAQNFPRTRIFELFDLRVGENLTGAFFEAEIISGGIYYKRRIPSATVIGSGITEADVIGTARQFTKGQGLTNVALSIAAGQTDIDFTDGNSFTLTLTADTELQLPTNDRPFSCQLWVLQDGTGGWDLTFATGWWEVGDTLTTVAGDKALINIASNGAGRLVAIKLNEQ